MKKTHIKSDHIEYNTSTLHHIVFRINHKTYQNVQLENGKYKETGVPWFPGTLGF